MKKILVLSSLSLLIFTGCVPVKKYKDLLESERVCQEELEKFKTASIQNEGLAKDVQEKLNVLGAEATKLRQDTARLGENYRLVQAQYDRMVMQNLAYEKRLDEERLAGQKTTGALQSDLESLSIELQRKQGVLNELESELRSKQSQLEDRERRVNELEEMLARKDDAVKALKSKVTNALRGFENKGLTVHEKNGKVYVSLEAKLLFNSGSTVVEPQGKIALIELARVLEKEKELEVIVEGHTDTDKINSTITPKSNWELSVLRATSVVEIMLKNSSVDPKILMAAGKSEYFPIDIMDKAKNRRIEIIISPDLSALFELINK